MRSTLQAEFEQSLAVNRDRVAIKFEGRDYIYEDLERWSRVIAAQLRGIGVGVGDRVALYMQNAPEFAATDIAIARLGAVKVPVNYMLAAESVEYIIDASGTKVLVADRAMSARIAGALADRPALPVLQTWHADGLALDRAQWLASVPETAAELPLIGPSGAGPSDLAAIYFTGGTTGKPKGVLHTQASTIALHYAQILEGEIQESERLLLMTPLAHAAGLFTQSALIRGATIILRDGFDADEAARLIIDGEVTWSFLVPTMIYRLLDLLEGKETASLPLRTIVYGAAPISPVRLEQALGIFGRVFIQLYGQTESPNWGTRLAKTDHDLTRPHLLTSCGKASIMGEVQIVDDDDGVLGPWQTGEICLRTPYTLLGYLNDEKATNEKFLGDWIRTGDIGEMSEDGYLYLKDRKNDMVISGGMNVYSREVEDVLSGHPDVKGVAVIGVPHDDWGEAVHAVVVARDGSGLEAAELIAWSRERLAAYARPKSVEFVGALPETAFGKVDKKALREPYWATVGRSIS